MGKQTALYDVHVQAGAKMVDFGGWDMPVQYPAGILTEVYAVRTAAGIFDVSHMGQIDAAVEQNPLAGSAQTLHDLCQRIDEIAHLRILNRRFAAAKKMLKRADKDWNDRRAAFLRISMHEKRQLQLQ